MSNVQPGILAPVPAHGRYLVFKLLPGAQPGAALQALARRVDGSSVVLGVGESVLRALGRELPGLRSFAGAVGPGLELPATPAALWCWLRGDDAGDLVRLSRRLQHDLAGAFELDQAVQAFRHGSGRDLSGYEDGTENPTGDAALHAAVVANRGPGLDGGSFVAVQQWLHDFARLEAFGAEEQDRMMGRRRSDNVELDDAPESSHVKRTAQESFSPEAFVLRRSMPWAEGARAGLMFVAFGRGFDAFEAQLRRMHGAEDGICDALFRFTQPISGAYFWCPPLRDGRLDLRALGL